VQWKCPPPGIVKINFDGSMQNNSVVGGYIIRDWKRNLPRAGSSYYGCALIIVAEARAFRDGVKEACAAGYKKLIIEGNNLVIIRALLGTASAPRQIN